MEQEDLQPITIVVACDDHYLIMLAALLKSIELNHKTEEPIRVFIVEDNVSRKNKSRLEASVTDGKISLHWIKMSDTIPKGMQFPLDNNTYPLNIYIRLLIPYFLPKEIKRVLFLDVDMIMLEDISKLWHTDIGDKTIGAVTDSVTKTLRHGVANYKELGLDPDVKYYNAGLQIINLEKWRAQGMTEKIFKSIEENISYAKPVDQYGANVCMVNQWHELDPLWNYFSNGNNPSPYLIHYFHRKPFYKSYSNNPLYKDIFYDYLNQTPWSNSKPVGELSRYAKKLSNVLQKVPLLFSSKLSLNK